MPARLLLGTSGWVYDHWADNFYPAELPKRDWFAFYAARFSSVEINNTFYRLPEEKVVARWRDAAPEGFTYVMKGHRYVTHRKKLLEPERTVKPVLERYRLMGEKLAAVLWQLPPTWEVNVSRLQAFLDVLPEDLRHVVEFRNDSWYVPEVYDALARREVALCLHDLDGKRSPEEVTADLVYLRFHGPERAYKGLYGRSALAPRAKKARRWLDTGRDVFAFFNNDEHAYATRDAAAFAALIRRSAARLPEVESGSPSDEREAEGRK